MKDKLLGIYGLGVIAITVLGMSEGAPFFEAILVSLFWPITIFGVISKHM